MCFHSFQSVCVESQWFNHGPGCEELDVQPTGHVDLVATWRKHAISEEMIYHVVQGLELDYHTPHVACQAPGTAELRDLEKLQSPPGKVINDGHSHIIQV